MADEQRTYHAYLLRLWRVNTGRSTVWHASLEDSRTGERNGFVDVKSLCAFLEEQATTDRGRPVRENPAQTFSV
jgi:hypothetical protein